MRGEGVKGLTTNPATVEQCIRRLSEIEAAIFNTNPYTGEIKIFEQRNFYLNYFCKPKSAAHERWPCAIE